MQNPPQFNLPSDHFAKVANRTNGLFETFHPTAMAVVDLVHPDVTHRIAADLLVTKPRRFAANQELTREPHRVQSAVAVVAFRTFVAALEGNAVDITQWNSAELSQLCEEFGFDGLPEQLSLFQLSTALRDAEARCRISVLEERWQQSERQIAELPSELSQGTETQERAMTALKAEVAQLKEAVGGMAVQAALPLGVDRAEMDIARVGSEAGAIGQLRADIAALREVVLQPRLGLVNWLIVRNFLRCFMSSAGSASICCGAAAATVSPLGNSTAAATAARTL
jgi:hypothetical protein